MTWVRLDDGWDTHPKMVRAMALVGDAAPAVWSRAVTRCCRHLTDGIVSGAELHSLTTHRQPRKVVDALVFVGLLEVVEGVVDHYRLHDFLDWNDSREAVEARRAVKREAGAKGGRASVQVRQGSSKAQAPCLPPGSSLENPSPSPLPLLSAPLAPSELRAEHAAPPEVSKLVPSGLTADAIRQELARHPQTADLARGTFAETLLGRAAASSRKLDWVVAAIAEAAADTPAHEAIGATQKRVRAYCDRAAPPRQPKGMPPVQPLSDGWRPRRVDDPNDPLPAPKPGEATL